MKGQWGKVVGYVLGAAVISAVFTLALPLLGSGTGWLPSLVSKEGSSIDALFWGLVWLSIAIFAIVAGIVLYSIVHFRAKPGDLSDGEHIHGNFRMEVLWIVIPTIIVFVVGVFSWIVLEDNEIGLYDEAQAGKPGSAEMVVDVRGFSFGWGFRYLELDGTPMNPDEDAEPSAELVLPVDQTVKFDVMACSGKERLGRTWRTTVRDLSSEQTHEESELPEIEPGLCELAWDASTDEEVAATVEDATRYYAIKQRLEAGKKITPEDREYWDSLPRFHGDDQFIEVNHAFWVPEARLKIDAVAGLRTYVQWTPDELTGPDDLYQVVCAELCGSGHNAMRTDMCVVDQATFDWWIDLGPDERGDANCVNLRRMNCFEGDVDDRAETLAAIAKVTKEDPEASCEDVEEQAA
jgi:heme/copper-type cytochrome/quinol oxidase subunit 2